MIDFHCCEQVFFHIEICGLSYVFSHDYQHIVCLFNQQLLEVVKIANKAVFKPYFNVDNLWVTIR